MCTLHSNCHQVYDNTPINHKKQKILVEEKQEYMDYAGVYYFTQP